MAHELTIRYSALLFALAAGGCGEPAAEQPPEPPPPFETALVPGVVPAPGQDSLPPRLFLDLDRYEWYAQERPLIWRELEWEPAGRPVPLQLGDLRLMGEFEGVDFYAPPMADSVLPDRLYVPVSEGFWLPFAPIREAGT